MILTDTQKTQLKVLKLFAKQRGFKVVFRCSNKEPGRFTFFIYKKDVSNKYLVGFDGHIECKEYNFDKCHNQVICYINNYLENQNNK